MVANSLTALDSLLSELSNEGWAHNNEQAQALIAPIESARIDFSARKLPKNSKLVAFSLESNYYQAHRLLHIAAKRRQLWINVDETLSFWAELRTQIEERFEIQKVGSGIYFLIPLLSR